LKDAKVKKSVNWCDDTPNKSMDVRAKQRLFYQRRPLPLTCVLAVSPHVISNVGRFVVKLTVYYEKHIKNNSRRNFYAFPV
jgi:hypothetical protein